MSPIFLLTFMTTFYLAIDAMPKDHNRQNLITKVYMPMCYIIFLIVNVISSLITSSSLPERNIGGLLVFFVILWACSEIRKIISLRHDKYYF